jgi:8-oxo-dGTP diphosphatase
LKEETALETGPTWTPVVALALQDGEGRYLLQQRPAHKQHGGLWEFPGGKVNPGESPRVALCREIAEELGITLVPAALHPALLADDGADGRLVLFLYSASAWTGEIEGLESQQWGWFSHQQACLLPMPPMDRDFIARLGQ